jgi:hypothetical protein
MYRCIESKDIYKIEDSLNGPYHAHKKIEQYVFLDFLE